MPETSTAQGRYYVLDNGPVVDPARCGVCGYGGKERRYIDPRLDFEFYGTLIFCEECVASMALLFDFIKPTQAHALERRVEEAERELIQLRAATAAMEAFRVAVGYLPGSSAVDSVDSSSSGDGSDVSPATKPAAPTVISGASTDTYLTEPVDEPGRDDLRDPNAGKRDAGLSL